MGVAMREDGGTVGVFSPKKVKRHEASPLLLKPILTDSIIHRNACLFTPKPSDNPRMPQPVFIDTVGLFSPNEVCSCEVLEAASLSLECSQVSLQQQKHSSRGFLFFQ